MKQKRQWRYWNA